MSKRLTIATLLAAAKAMVFLPKVDTSWVGRKDRTGAKRGKMAKDVRRRRVRNKMARESRRRNRR